MPDIRHVVVLMLENRSFDHMLGFLDGRAEPVDGLTGNETNHVDPLNPASPAIPVSRNASYTIDPGPGHELGDVNVQLFGNATAPTPPAAVNSGFVRRHLEKTRDAGLAARVMDCFDPARLPTLTQLAREFMVCDRWFCSVPGPTHGPHRERA